ncbi:hypothetical protein N7456_007848 [Penicillium angulare]|uniref:Uncharacterized protein n=1 Tax=Penicillium angulare TaxID=116970 RepID=A0A9W9K9N2_9EURO|nr:hypothetical protein N7456_007848 [Penicillium angulare]
MSEKAPLSPARTGYRSLTPPLIDTPAPLWQKVLGANIKPQKCFDQNQSPLARLPAEVRRIIWGYCDLWGNQLHMVRTKHRRKEETDRVLGVVCSKPLDDFACNTHDCWGKVPAKKRARWGLGCVRYPPDRITDGNRWYLGPLRGTTSTRANFVPILRTCRWLFSMKNLFVPVRRLEDGNLPAYLNSYAVACKVLASMDSLKSLSIHHHNEYDAHWYPWKGIKVELFSDMIEELYQIQQVTKIDMILFYKPREEEDRLVGDDGIQGFQEDLDNHLQGRNLDLILRPRNAGDCGLSRNTES